jgi:MFS family permease
MALISTGALMQLPQTVPTHSRGRVMGYFGLPGFIMMGLGLACGMSHGTYYPSLSSIAAERFHPLHAGQGLSLYLASSALGMFVGPPIWGAIVDRTGYALMFLIAVLSIALGICALVVFQHRSRPARV